MNNGNGLDDMGMKETFKNLSDSLDTDYDEELTEDELDKEVGKAFKSKSTIPDIKEKSEKAFEVAQNEVNEIDARRDELQNQLMSAKIRDVDFLTHEIKSLILSSKKVLNTLERDIKVGTSPRMYEVYAGLVNAITSQYKELRQLNEAVAKFIIENKKQNLDVVKQEHKMVVSSNDMLQMYMDAKENSEMDTIDADFEITEDLGL